MSVEVDQQIPQEEPLQEQEQEQAQQEQAREGRSLLHGMEWFATTIFHGMEYVGETFVSILGLDDSKFQDVLDGMSAEEMKIAEDINETREQEYRDHERQQAEEKEREGDPELALMACAAGAADISNDDHNDPKGEKYVYVDPPSPDSASITMVELKV
jgi:hypothetical protein